MELPEPSAYMVQQPGKPAVLVTAAPNGTNGVLKRQAISLGHQHTDGFARLPNAVIQLRTAVVHPASTLGFLAGASSPPSQEPQVRAGRILISSALSGQAVMMCLDFE
jgi:hypothetical protein